MRRPLVNSATFTNTNRRAVSGKLRATTLTIVTTKFSHMNTKQRLIVLLALVSVILGCENNKKPCTIYKKYYPDNLESAHKLAVLATTFGKEKTTELFDRLDPSIKNSINGKLIEQYLLLNKDLKIGDHFVDFEMSDSNNQPRKLSEFQGKVVLLEFWASTCGGCLNETSFLKKAYEEYHNDDLKFWQYRLMKIRNTG